VSRPLVFLVLAAIAAMLASLVVYSSLKKKDLEVQQALATTQPIVVAARDIPIGAKIDSSMIKMARWPRNELPPGAITESTSVIGGVARAEFVQNEPIVASRLVIADKTSGVLPLMIPTDMRAMSVAVDEVSDMSGFILPYTKVDVLLSLTGGDKEGGRSKIVLQDVPVLAAAQTIQRKDQPQPERVVTLLVSPDQAERLAVASTQGKLHLALRGYGDNDFVPTSGADVHKVMGEAPPPAPVPINQSPPPVVRPVRRIVRRPRRPPPIEVLRNGSSRESIPLGSDGRALGGMVSASAGGPPSDGAGAGAPGLGDDDHGMSNDGVESVGSDSGMSGGAAGMNMGSDTK
jgi:pilus assembly protein CpaB